MPEAPQQRAEHDGELVGWRSWTIDLHGNLHGGRSVWRPGVNHALCSIKDHHAPDRSCTCGFYGKYDPSPHYGSMRGLILVWGKIARQPTEFRAEYAEPFCLIEISRHGLEISRSRNGQSPARRAAEYYEIPVVKDEKAAVAYAEARGFEFIQGPVPTTTLHPLFPGPPTIPNRPEPDIREVLSLQTKTVSRLSKSAIAASVVGGFAATSGFLLAAYGIHP